MCHRSNFADASSWHTMPTAALCAVSLPTCELWVPGCLLSTCASAAISAVATLAAAILLLPHLLLQPLLLPHLLLQPLLLLLRLCWPHTCCCRSQSHLLEVYKILKLWGADDTVCRCALFHR
jgi:hypothetical protein